MVREALQQLPLGSKGKATAFKTEFNKLVRWESEGRGLDHRGDSFSPPLTTFLPLPLPLILQ